jgi:hypothetical protein
MHFAHVIQSRKDRAVLIALAIVGILIAACRFVVWQINKTA